MQHSATKNSARWWFLAHSWLALPIWVFLFFVCLTGTIATVSQEIIWLIEPAVRANPPSDDARMLGYDEIVAALGREHPEAVVLNISRPDSQLFAWTVQVAYPDTSQVSHYVNPYTGHLQGSAAIGLSFRNFMRALHGWLLMPVTNRYNLGWYLVSALGLPLLGSLVTGLVVYKRFWRGFFRPRLRFDRGSRVFWGDFHRLAGIWSIPFILVIAVTALWFLFEAVLRHAQIELPSSAPSTPALIARENIPLAPAGQSVLRISLNQAAESMQKQFPGVEPSSFSFGANAFSPIAVKGKDASWPLFNVFALINPYTGNIERTRRVADRSALDLFSQSMRPLHTGDFGGIWLKLAYALFGSMLTMMVLSGLLIWVKRTAKATSVVLSGKHRETKELSAPEAPIPQGSPQQVRSKKRRWIYHLSALLLILPLIYLSQYLEKQQRPIRNLGLGERVIGQRVIGSWTVNAGEWIDRAPQSNDGRHEKVFSLQLCKDCIAKVKAAYLRVGRPQADIRASGVVFSSTPIRTAGALFFGSPYRLFATLKIPENIDPEENIWVTLEGWDGSIHQDSIPLKEASPATWRWARDKR